MARLPTPGGDNGNWGTILNDYLEQAHKSDGTLKDNAVTANTIAPNSVTNAAIATDAVNATNIADGSVTETLLASAVQTKLNQIAPTWSTLSGKPSVVAAGGTQAQARASIGALSSADVSSSAPIASRYRPLQGMNATITSTISSGLSPAGTAINWWEANGNVRWCGFEPEGLSSDPTLALNNNNTFAQSFAFQPLVVEFWSDATDIRITGYDVGQGDVWATIDDQRITDGFIHVDFADSYYTWRLAQGTPVWHKWRLCVSSSIYQISHNNGATMVPTSPGFQLAVIGDSYVQGNISINNAVSPGVAGRITAGNAFGEFEQKTGLDIWRCAIAGTGYVEQATFSTAGAYGSSQRVSKLAALPQMDAVLVVGTVNDRNHSVSSVVSAANAAWTAIKAAQPEAPLIVAGPEGFGWPDSTIDTLNDALRNAANAHSDVHSYIDLRGKNNYLSGTGYEGSPQGNGNSDVFVASDATHPTHLGSRHGAEHLARFIGEISIPS